MDEIGMSTVSDDDKRWSDALLPRRQAMPKSAHDGYTKRSMPVCLQLHAGGLISLGG